MTVVPPLPMLLIAVYWEGTDRIANSLQTMFDAHWALAGLLYTCVLGTVAGSGIWTWLLSRYQASAVAPFSMLVPVFGLGSAALVLGERINTVELTGCMMVVVGVIVASQANSRSHRAYIAKIVGR